MDYPLKESGFAVTVGQAVAEALGVTPAEWKENVCGLQRQEIIRSAATSLAYLYKRRLGFL